MGKAQAEKRGRISELRRSDEEERELSAPFNERIRGLSRNIETSSWTIFYDINKGDFFSHHDLLSLKKMLVVPAAYLERPFIEISNRLKNLGYIIKRENGRTGA